MGYHLIRYKMAKITSNLNAMTILLGRRVDHKFDFCFIHTDTVEGNRRRHIGICGEFQCRLACCSVEKNRWLCNRI